MKSVVGISYRLWAETNSRDALGKYKLAAALVESTDGRDWQVSKEESLALQFTLSTGGGWVPRDSDASSTMGLLGGIDDPKQARLSETLERNVADLLALVLSRWSDHRWSPSSASETAEVWLLGPALPKLVGRIASLRYGDRIAIRWATIRPAPKWYSLYPPFLASLAGINASADVLEALRIWTTGDLVSVGGGCSQDDAACIVEALTSTGGVRPIPDAELRGEFKSASWLGAGVRLPSALRASSLLLESGSYAQPLPFTQAGNVIELSEVFVQARLMSESAAKKVLAGFSVRAARGAGISIPEALLDECAVEAAANPSS